MLRFILLLTVVLALPAFAQPLAPAPDPAPVTSEATPKATPETTSEATPEVAPAAAPALTPEMPPEQRLTQFRHDQINLLALRADAHSLLAAALMAGPDAGDHSRPTALKSPALLARAQKSGEDVALVWWVTAGIECQVPTKTCTQLETLQQLEKSDAQNAAMWSLALAHAQQAKEAATARAALTSAAQAAQYDDHFGTLIAMLDAAAGILPVGEEILRASGQTVGSEGFKLTYAASIAASLPQPGLRALVEACTDAANNPDNSVAADCIAIAQKLADSGSLITRGYGARLLLELLPAGAEKDAARARARTLAWQTQRIGELAARLTGDPHVTRIYVGTLHDSGKETEAVQAVLRSQGVALEPPSDWKPPE
jgi:hypothetical protein